MTTFAFSILEYLEQWFSTGSNLPQRHEALSTDIYFGLPRLQACRCYHWHFLGTDKNVDEHPTMHRTGAYQNYLPQMQTVLRLSPGL